MADRGGGLLRMLSQHLLKNLWGRHGQTIRGEGFDCVEQSRSPLYKQSKGVNPILP